MKLTENSLKEFVKEFEIPNPVNITFTQRQVVRGVKIDDLVSERNFRYFKNILNKKVHGNSQTRFGLGLGMLVVREVSHYHRHHLHTIIERPLSHSPDQFEEIVRICWGKTVFGYHQIHFSHPSGDDGWLDYIMKKKTKVDLMDSVDWMNSHLTDHCRI